MTAELSSLTAKMDALREKGFSDEEINALLSPVSATPSHSLPLSEEDKAYAEQWNENIEETARTSWKVFFMIFVFAFIIAYPMFIAQMDDSFAVPWFIGGFIILFVGIIYASYKQEQRVKFF